MSAGGTNPQACRPRRQAVSSTRPARPGRTTPCRALGPRERRHLRGCRPASWHETRVRSHGTSARTGRHARHSVRLAAPARAYSHNSSTWCGEVPSQPEPAWSLGHLVARAQLFSRSAIQPLRRSGAQALRRGRGFGRRRGWWQPGGARPPRARERRGPGCRARRGGRPARRGTRSSARRPRRPPRRRSRQ